MSPQPKSFKRELTCPGCKKVLGTVEFPQDRMEEEWQRVLGGYCCDKPKCIAQFAIHVPTLEEQLAAAKAVAEQIMSIINEQAKK